MPRAAIWLGLGMESAPGSMADAEGWEIIWLAPDPPLPRESLEQWSRRMALKIPEDIQVLGGFSLGGMLALSQMSLYLDLTGLVLFSYTKGKNGWRLYLRVLAAIGVLRIFLLLPAPLLRSIAIALMRFFGKRTHFTMQKALKAWNPVALKQVFVWMLQFKKGRSALPCVEIIGSRDPWLRGGQEAQLIEGAGHFMFPRYRHQVATAVISWWKNIN